MLEKIIISLIVVSSIILTIIYSVAGFFYALFIMSIIVIFNGAVKGRKT